MKNIKKLLASQSNDILPDKRVKQEIMQEFDGQYAVKVYADGSTETKHNKKGPIAVIAVALALLVAVCVALPVLLKDKSTPSINTITTISTEDFYAYGAASAASILYAKSVEEDSASAAKAMAKTKVTADSTYSGNNNVIDVVSEYIYYVEEMLGNSSVTYSTSATDGDYSNNYQYAMTIAYSDLLGTNVKYTMYFNETATGSQTNKDEIKTLYEISGVLVVDGIEYTITGGRSNESETDEESNEIWFKAYTDSDSYILIKQEYETETEDGEIETEQTTEIYVYNNGILTESVVAEMEVEDGETELELEITKDGVKNTLEFNYETKNSNIIIDVKAVIDKTKYSFKIYVEEDAYRYVFSDGEYLLQRN